MKDGTRHRCERCAERKARYQYAGVVRADRHHTLCFQCFRSERERLRARALDPARASTPPAMVVLTPQQRAHRFRMLQHLRRSAPVASGG